MPSAYKGDQRAEQAASCSAEVGDKAVSTGGVDGL